MRVPGFVLRFLQRKLIPITESRPADEIVGSGERSRLREGPHRDIEGAFMHRWFVFGRKNRWLNVYVHKFTRDDEDRALHDHPWWNLSVLLKGAYIEHTIAAGGIHRRERLTEGRIKLRAPWAAHRVECLKEYDSLQPGTSLKPIPCWSLFITGPVQQRWGFHCPGEWKWHKDFGREGGCGTSQRVPTHNVAN